MAAQFETSPLIFELTRLRGVDTSYFGGAVGVTGQPLPIITAVGPKPVTNVGAIGVAENWGVAVAIPAVPEVVWVVVQMEVVLGNAGASPPLRMAYWMAGEIGDMDEFTGPVISQGLAPGAAAGEPGQPPDYRPASAGDNTRLIPLSGRPASLWLPLDPDLTAGGWTSIFNANAGAVGVAAGVWDLDLTGVRLIGYPVNYWDTGALWANTQGRGS